MNEKDYDFAGLVKKCKEIREKVQYRDLFEKGYDRFYLSAKDIPFVGYFQRSMKTAFLLWMPETDSKM